MCAEVPEFCGLQDDTSNDGESLSYLCDSVRRTSPRPNPRRSESSHSKGSPAEDLRSFPLYPTTKWPTRSGQELLHLLSVQRK